MAKIFIDPGHGGHDPGAIGKRSNEKTNVLKVAKQIKKLLESKGHTVKMSRESDKYLTLTQRTNMANAWKADVFVSLHDNSATSSSATGFETFIYNGNVSSKTRELQKQVHGAILREITIRDRGMKRANFAVVRQSKMPSVLIEYAFISNTNDESILINEVGALAKGTANGILKFLGSSTISKAPSVKPSPSKPTPSTPKPSKPSGSKKTIAQMADEINRGLHGNGHENRRKSLGISKAEYEKVRAEVNKKSGVKTTSKPKPTNKKSIATMAQEIRANKHGNGHENRRKSLGISKAEYEKVRAEVNRLEGIKTSTKSSSSQPSIRRGGKVRIKKSAKTYSRTSATIPARFKGKWYTIQQVGKNDVLLKEIYSWVKKSDLY